MWITNWQEWKKWPQVFKASEGLGAMVQWVVHPYLQSTLFTHSNTLCMCTGSCPSGEWVLSLKLLSKPWNYLLKLTDKSYLDFSILVKQKECLANFGTHTSKFYRKEPHKQKKKKWWRRGPSKSKSLRQKKREKGRSIFCVFT